MRRMFSEKQIQKIAKLVAQAEIEIAEGREIYELPAEPTQAQLGEAMKHKFIKTTDDMVFVLIEVDDSEEALNHYYSCTYAFDDGISGGGIDVLGIAKTKSNGHYSTVLYENSFDGLLRFSAHDKGKVLVVLDNGQSVPQDLFTAFTHSLAELDATLRGIIESSIADQEAKPCTQEQWNAIKSVLDKSLYFNYEGVSMIKAITNGIDYYLFGSKDAGDYTGYSLFFQYEPVDGNLLVKYTEL